MCFAPQRRAIFRHLNFKKWSEAVRFLAFDLKMCFSLQRRAIFPHLNFKKWSEHALFCAFWLQNVLLATAACNFTTSQLQKVARECSVLYILTSKCASPYSGVQFFHISTSEHALFCAFWLQNVLLATAACDFTTSQLQKVARECSVLYILTSKCASRYSGVQFFMSPRNSYLRTRRFTEVTFRPSRRTNHWKTQHFATSLTFRACGSSFYWLSRHLYLLSLSSDSTSLLCLFLLWLCCSALLFQLSILSEVRLPNFLRICVF